MIPQIIIIGFSVASFTYSTVKHGQKDNRTYKWYITLIAQIINLLILYWGGFFDVMMK